MGFLTLFLCCMVTMDRTQLHLILVSPRNGHFSGHTAHEQMILSDQRSCSFLTFGPSVLRDQVGPISVWSLWVEGIEEIAPNSTQRQEMTIAVVHRLLSVRTFAFIG